MRAVLLLAAALAAFPLQAAACGFCVEDKMAAVYDHAAVTRALAQKHQVAFFHVEGALAAGAAMGRELAALANAASGVDKGTARVSVESASLSVAFDPQRTSVIALQAALERRLAARKISLMLLDVMSQPKDFSPSVARTLGRP